MYTAMAEEQDKDEGKKSNELMSNSGLKNITLSVTSIAEAGTCKKCGKTIEACACRKEQKSNFEIC